MTEEELHNLVEKIREKRISINKLKREKVALEKEYKLKYAYNDWKKKEGLYFSVEGDNNESFCCHVIKVDKVLKEFEYIDLIKGTYALEKITDPKEDCGYIRWVEITKEEYEKEKVEKQHIK